MRRRWSDAQYTGRYLRRTIVHGKRTSKPVKKSETDAGNNSGGVGPLVLLVLIVAVLIGLFIWSKGLFCIALVILLFIISAL